MYCTGTGFGVLAVRGLLMSLGMSYFKINTHGDTFCDKGYEPFTHFFSPKLAVATNRDDAHYQTSSAACQAKSTRGATAVIVL